MSNESTKWLYDNLTAEGYNVGKDLAEFDSLIVNNEESRKWAFEAARNLGYNVGKDYNEFTNLVAPKMTEDALDVAPMGDTPVPFRPQETQEVLDLREEKKRLEGLLDETRLKADERRKAISTNAGAFQFGMAPITGNAANEIADSELTKYSATENELNQAIREVDRRILGEKPGFWQGMMDATLRNPSFYTLGLSDMADSRAKLDIAENGIQSETDEVLADAIYTNSQLQETSDKGFMYRAGNMFGHSVPFMVEMAATGGFSGVSNLGKKAVKEGVEETVKQKIGRMTGVAADELIEAAMIANTAGAANTQANILNRKAGRLQKDEDGNFYFDNKEGWLEAAYKGEMSSVLEMFSEKLGNHIDGKLSLVKGLDKLGAKKISKALTVAQGNDLMKGATTIMKQFGLNGVLPEVLEEEANIFLNGLLVDSKEFKQLYNPQTQADIIGGMFLTVGTMRAVPGTIGSVGYVKNQRNLNKADKEAASVFGEKWNNIREELNNASNEDVSEVLAKEIDGTNADNKPALLNYYKQMMIMRGYNIGSTKRDEDLAGLENAYQEAYQVETTGDAAVMATKELQQAEDEVRVALGLDQGDDINAFVNNIPTEELSKGDEYITQAVNNYKRAMANFAGVQDKFTETRETQYQESDNAIDRKANNGMIYSTMLDDKEVFITGGNVVLTEDGFVDVNNSSEALYVTMPDRTVREMPAENIPGAIATENAEEKKMIARAQIDAQWKELFDSADPNVLKFTDDNGTHTMEVVKDNGDGTSTVILDGVETSFSNNFVENVKEANGVQDTTGEEQVEKVGPAPADEQGAPVVDKKARRAVLEAQIPVKGKKKLFTEVEPAVTAEYIQLLTDDTTKQIATADKYIANIQAAQEKADPIEALEMEEQVAYWESVKAMLMPEQAESTVNINETEQSAPTLEDVNPQATNEMKPVTEPAGFSGQLEMSVSDNQGNPIDENGRLIVEEVATIDDITDADFDAPTRNVQLPALPENVATAIGTNGKPVVIKKNVFEKNGNTHVELEPADSREILKSALYNPNIVGATQPIKRPDYKVAIRTGEKNAVVVLDVFQGKDHVEIVGWRQVNEKGLAKMQRQAEREGGQFLILSPNDGSAAALSALPFGLSSESEDRNLVSKEQENTQKSDENAENGGENITESDENVETEPINDSGKLFVEEVVPETVEKFVASVMPKITPESFKKETGLSNGEQRQLVGYIAGKGKGGITIEQAAESILANYSDELLGLGFKGDEQDVRDMIINILSNGNPKGYIKRSRALREAELSQHEREMADVWAEGMGFDSYENYLDYTESLLEDIEEQRKDFDETEYYNNLAKNNEYDTTGERKDFGRGGELLQGEQFVTTTPSEVVGEGYEGTAIPGDVRGGGDNALTQGEQIQAAEAEVNTNPTEAQKEAGNYKKGHVQIGTFNVTIEQPKGSVRSGVDADGKKWEVEMRNTYGYIRGTEGVDGDHIDVFLSDDIDGWDGRKVFVVDQRNADGSFDEHKVMLGFNDINDAEAAYMSNYEEGWQGLGAITGVSIEEFEKWIASSHRKTKAFAEYKNVKTDEEIQEPRSVEEVLENGDKRITNYNSRGEVATVALEHNGRIVAVDSYDEGVLFEHTEYDENGVSTSVTRYDKQGNPVVSGKTEQPETKGENRTIPTKNEVKNEKIEDVGEKIGGAKKDILRENFERLKTEMEQSDETLMDKLAKLPVSKVFNFDFKKLREGGMPNEAISFMEIIKKSVPAKPRTPYKVKRWVNNTLALYKLCLEVGTNWDKANTALNSRAFAGSNIKELFDAYMSVGGFDSGLNIGDAKLRQLDNKSGRYDENGKFVTLEGKWYVRDAGKHGGIYDTKEEAVKALKAFAGDNAGVTSSGKKKDVKFAIYQRRQDKSIFIAVKGKADIVIQDGFTSAKEAFDYIEANNAELQERYRNLLDKTTADFEENRERKGRDYRNGKDIPAEEFRNTFGFRGVEFGNWMTQEDRRKALNECYDALMDLAAVCKVSPKALSLGGSLGMAFGARGGGKFSAHYEPDKVVINLTKTQGAGSLAHEWFHALDNYFAKMGDVEFGYATGGEGMRPEGVQKYGKRFFDKKSGTVLTEEEFNERVAEHGVRAEMADAWGYLMDALKRSDYYKRSLAYANLHNSDYWKRPTELGARAFSVWVENELSKMDASNDYLANNPRYVESEVKSEIANFAPYPFDTDAVWMDEAFGNLFEVMQEKVDEDENAVLYRTAENESIENVNERFNEQLDSLTEENADVVELSLGAPSLILKAAGVKDMPMKLYGNKVIKKMKKHGFKLEELKNLPVAVADPIAVFNNHSEEGNRAILTELKTADGNFLVTVDLGDGTDIDFNIVSSVFGKSDNKIVHWFNKGFATYINKEKALDYLHLSAPIAEASDKPELSSATKIINDFENPIIEDENLTREGAGPLTDREVVMDSDPYSKALGRPRYTGKKMQEYVARQRVKMANKVQELAGKLNLNIDVLESAEGLTGKKAKAKGWYEPSTKKIVVVIPNNTSITDAVQTVLHEAVAHHGLREMFGENFDAFLDNIFNNVDNEVKARIETLAQRYNGNTKVATEEYLASLAEDTYFEKMNPTLWERIKSGFVNMLAKVGIKLDYEMNDNELRYILWRSYQNLANPGEYKNVVERIKDVAKQYELKVGEYNPAINNMVAEENILTRIPDETIDAVNEFYEKNYGAATVKFIENLDEFKDLGFTDKEIKEIITRAEKGGAAFYNSDRNTIYLLRRDFGKDVLKALLWHENTHKAVADLGITQELLDDYYALVDEKQREAFEKQIAEEFYEREEYAEEYLARFVEDLYNGKRLSSDNYNVLSRLKNAPENVRKQIEFIQQILNHIVNGRQGRNELRSRMVERGFTGETIEGGKREGADVYDNATKKSEEGTGRGNESWAGGFPGGDKARERKPDGTQRVEMRNAGNTGGNAQETGRTAEETRETESTITREAVKALAQKLNTHITIIEDSSTLPEDRKDSKGWYDANTGEVAVVMENCVSTEDAVETVLHEVVGHKGLREIVGDKLDELLDDVYKNASPQMKRAIDNKFFNSIRNGRVLTVRECTEEYMAELAERGFEGYNDTWEAIKQWMRDAIRRIVNIEVSDNEIRYMLWKNYNRLQRGPIARINDIAMEAKTNTGNNGVMFRKNNTGGIGERYTNRVEGLWKKIWEGWYDGTRSIKVAMKEIAKETGKEIMDSANVYDYANHIPSINRNKMERFDNKFIQPFLKFLKVANDLQLSNGEKLDQKALERYANAKHGIERNREMAVKNAMTEVLDGKRVFNKKAHDSYIKERDAILNNGMPWKEQQKALDELAGKYGAKITDYSGLTAIFDPEGKVKYSAVRSKAIEYVEMVEEALNGSKEVSTDRFWELINGMTGFALKEDYESGMTSKERYEEMKNMYRFYVPLRGFSETTADEMYDYVTEQKSVLNSVVKSAHGRKSEAADIFATILNMANSAIVYGSKNRLKQRLLNLAMMYRTPLLSVNEAWYVKSGNEYEPRYPEINENMSPEEINKEMARFENEMKELEAKGLAMKQKQGLSLKYRPVENWQKNQHAVAVKRNGKEYIIYVNGSPRLANAINGLLLEEDTNKVFDLSNTVNQWRAKMVTGYSPLFVTRNLVRDIQSSSIVYYIRRGAAMMKMFDANVMKILPKIHGLYKLYKEDKLDMNIPMHRYFKEFLENGGETGYTEMVSIEEWDKKMKDFVKKNDITKLSKNGLKAMGDGVEFINRGVENTCRFAAYMTSRENGISILQSVNDAKEVSVNFNRKGSGAYGQLEAKKLFMFLNPAIQAAVQRVTMTIKAPEKMAKVYATEFIMGAAAPIIFGTLAAMLRGDDDNEEVMGNYFNMTDFARRSNICLPVGNGVIKIPLAHESRVMYGLGELLTSYIMGHTEFDNVGMDIVNTFAQVLPLNPVEGWTPGDDLGKMLFLNFTPDAIKPFVEVDMNANFAGSKIHNRNAFNDYMPEYKRGSRSTGPTFVAISKFITGGEHYGRNGADELLGGNVINIANPSALEHYTQSYLGGLYTFFNEAQKTARWALGNEEFAEFKNVPIANGFFTDMRRYEENPSEQRTRRDWEKAYQFYYDDVEIDVKTEKDLRSDIRRGDKEAQEEYDAMIARGEALRIDIFNAEKKKLNELYKQKDEARVAKEFNEMAFIDQRIYDEKKRIVEKMEKLAEDPQSGYLMRTEKDNSTYGQMETYGDVREQDIINEFVKTLKTYADAADNDESGAVKEFYKKELKLMKDLKKEQDKITRFKKYMNKNPKLATKWMTKIRETRVKMIEIIETSKK